MFEKTHVDDSHESDQLAPGDRVLWAAKNGTVRHGVIKEWQAEVSRWFVEIEPDSTLPGGDGFRTWFRPEDLIKVEPAEASADEAGDTVTCQSLVYVGGWDYVEPCGAKMPCRSHDAD